MNHKSYIHVSVTLALSNAFRKIFNSFNDTVTGLLVIIKHIGHFKHIGFHLQELSDVYFGILRPGGIRCERKRNSNQSLFKNADQK